MDEHAQTLAQRIEHARKAKGWSKEKLALEAGVVYKTIVRLEKGEVVKPQSATLDKLALALDLDIRLLDRGRPTLDELSEDGGPLQRIEAALTEILRRLPDPAQDLEQELDDALQQAASTSEHTAPSAGTRRHAGKAR